MSTPNPNGNGNRIAIKLGASTAASSTPSNNKPSARPKPPSSLGKRGRSQPWGNDDSGSEDERTHGASETITGFGASGAVVEKKNGKGEEKTDLVIKPQKNRDWRAEKRRQTGAPGGSEGEGALGQDAERAPPDEERDIVWGLNVPGRKAATADNGESASEAQPEPTAAKASEDDKPQDVDDEAIDALLGKTKERPDLVIPSSRREDSAYQQAVADTGVAPTLADYEAMPVEDFGAALLRGMGWDGKFTGQQKERARRTKGLGLGATEMEGMAGGDKKKERKPTLSQYNREKGRGSGSGREDSYKRERERERERERGGYRDHRDRDRNRDGERHRDGGRDRHRDGDRGRDRDRHRDYDRRR